MQDRPRQFPECTRDVTSTTYVVIRFCVRVTQEGGECLWGLILITPPIRVDTAYKTRVIRARNVTRLPALAIDCFTSAMGLRLILLLPVACL